MDGLANPIRIYASRWKPDILVNLPIPFFCVYMGYLTHRVSMLISGPNILVYTVTFPTKTGSGVHLEDAS